MTEALDCSVQCPLVTDCSRIAIRENELCTVNRGNEIRFPVWGNGLIMFFITIYFYLFVPPRIFHSLGDVTTTVKGWQFWPMLSTYDHWAVRVFLACYIDCDTVHSFYIMIIPEYPWHSHLLTSVWQWICHYLYLRLRTIAAGIRTPNLPLAG